MMQANEFTRDWKQTRAVARAADPTEFTPVFAQHDGQEFEIAKWSQFSMEYDDHKIDLYLSVNTTVFGESISEMLDHTAHTGIGKIVRFRDTPRYVLDPGRNWRSFQASKFGVTRARYNQAIGASRFVQRLLENERTELRKERFTLISHRDALQEAIRDLQIECAIREQEVRHLRHEVARAGAE